MMNVKLKIKSAVVPRPILPTFPGQLYRGLQSNGNV